MSQLFDAIKEGLTKAKAPQELQDKISSMISEAGSVTDSTESQPYRQISLAFFKVFKPYDEYYPGKAERLIPKIIETNAFILQDFLDFERELNGRLAPIRQTLGLTPAWLFPAQLLGGLVGAIIAFVGTVLLGVGCALSMSVMGIDGTLGQWFFVFVAMPAAWGLGKSSFLEVPGLVENSRIPKALDNNPNETKKVFLYKSMINLLRINYQIPVDMYSMKVAVSDGVAALVFYNPDAISEMVQAIVSLLPASPAATTNPEQVENAQ
jgi:hypothetical protein